MSFLSNIFGGNSVQAPQINYTPGGFTSPGLTASYAGQGNFNIGSSPAQSSLIGGLQSTFSNQANALGNLAKTVQPGFSQFRQAGLRQLNTQQQAATSNLRDTLAQRRILGSSFANASLSQNAAEFGQQKADFIAQSYLGELNASQQLIQQQYQAAAQSYSVGISQMNFETGVAAQLTSQTNSALANVATAQAKIDAETAQFNAKQQASALGGVGGFLGSLLTAPLTGGTSLFGMGVNSLFGSGQPTPNAADLGGPGIGTGGFNYIDAQSGVQP